MLYQIEYLRFVIETLITVWIPLNACWVIGPFLQVSANLLLQILEILLYIVVNLQEGRFTDNKSLPCQNIITILII